MTWLYKTRLKILAYVVGIVLAGFGLVSLTAIPAWPVVGVVVAAAAMLINTAAHRLSDPICLGCGRDISKLPDGEHGVICPDCGTICFKPDQVARRLNGPAAESKPDAAAAGRDA